MTTIRRIIMTNSPPWRGAGLMLFSALVSVGSMARAADYSLAILAQTGDTVGGKTLTALAGPAINNSGTVIYLGAFSGGTGVFSTGRSGDNTGSPTLVLKTGDVIDGQTLTGIGPLLLNDRNTVAFSGSISSPAPGGSAAIIGPLSGDTPDRKFRLAAKTGDTINGYPLAQGASIGVTGLSGSDLLALSASILNGNAVQLAFFTESAAHGHDKQFVLAATNGTLIGGKTLTGLGSTATSNDRGALCFVGLFAGGSGIFTQSRPIIQAADHVGGQTLTTFVSVPAINDAGTAAFLAETGNYSVGVFTQNELVAKQGDTIGGETLTQIDQNLSEPAINSRGNVYFEGAIAGGYGIFTGSSLIVKTGDNVGGKALSGISELQANDAGEVVFRGVFADSSQAIIAARPQDH